MATDQNEQAMNDLTTGIAADHKAEQQLRKPSFDASNIGGAPVENEPDPAGDPPAADHVGTIEPDRPEVGDSWHNPETGKTRYFHSNKRWYMKPEDAATGASAPAPAAPAAAEQAPEAKVDNSPSISPETAVAQLEDEEDDDDDDFGIEFDDRDIELTTRQLIPDIRDAMLEIFKHRPKPWSALRQEEQRDVAAFLEHKAREMVRKAVEAIATNGGSAIRCLLEGYSEKSGGLTATMKVQAFSEEEGSRAVLFLHQNRGKHVMVNAASADDYSGDRDPQTDADEPEIDFDPKLDDSEIYHGDNEDLGADEDFESEEEADEAEQVDDDFEASEEELALQEGRGGFTAEAEDEVEEDEEDDNEG